MELRKDYEKAAELFRSHRRRVGRLRVFSIAAFETKMTVEREFQYFQKKYYCTFRLDALRFFVANINHIENYANLKSHAFLCTHFYARDLNGRTDMSSTRRRMAIRCHLPTPSAMFTSAIFRAKMVLMIFI